MVKVKDLRQITLLENMPGHLLEIIAAEANLSIFSTHKELYRINDNIDTFYMLLMGQVALKVELSPHIDIILDTIQSGSSFGLSFLGEGALSCSTAVCQEPCEVITLNGKRMQQMLCSNAELGYHFMRRLAVQYKRVIDNRTQMIMKTLDEHPEYKNKIIDLDKLTPIY